MTGKKTGTRLALLLLALLLAAPAFTVTASAAERELEQRLPGVWTFVGEAEKEGDIPRQISLSLTFEADGRVTYVCDGSDKGYRYICEGTWAFEYVPEYSDKLTLIFTKTNNPLQDPSTYYLVCEYAIYTESWEEESTEVTALILEEVSHSGTTPFEEVFGWDGIALDRYRKPNMQVVNCRDYVSLRAEPSSQSDRILKVPLGALVLAYTELGEKDGFYLCLTQGEYGYIMTQYLRPIE